MILCSLFILEEQIYNWQFLSYIWQFYYRGFNLLNVLVSVVETPDFLIFVFESHYQSLSVFQKVSSNYMAEIYGHISFVFTFWQTNHCACNKIPATKNWIPTTVRHSCWISRASAYTNSQVLPVAPQKHLTIYLTVMPSICEPSSCDVLEN